MMVRSNRSSLDRYRNKTPSKSKRVVVSVMKSRPKKIESATKKEEDEDPCFKVCCLDPLCDEDEILYFFQVDLSSVSGLLFTGGHSRHEARCRAKERIREKICARQTGDSTAATNSCVRQAILSQVTRQSK